jgi:hypothetical protein
VYDKGLIILFRNGFLNKAIYTNSKSYIKKGDLDNKIINLESRNSKKNLLIFKNKGNYIKYKKYDKITFKFNNTDNYYEFMRQ